MTERSEFSAAPAPIGVVLRPRTAPLNCHLVPEAALEERLSALRRPVLSIVRYATDDRPRSARAPLEVRVPLPQLGSAPLVEVWSTPDEPRRGEREGVRFAATPDLLFGAVDVPDESGGLEAAVREAYLRVLAVARAEGLPFLLRMWNYIPRINEDEGPLERYKLFCAGRAAAFAETYGEGFTERLPAGTGVGSCGREVTICFLAAREQPEHHENPRQTSAYRYPPCYGPRSPSFSRATRAPGRLGDVIFLAGTASVVGHESRHGGHAGAQAAESLRNVSALFESIGSRHGRAPENPVALSQVKVYLRRRTDAAAVREALSGIDAQTLYLEADICRRELLFEIEGVHVGHPFAG